MAAPNPKKALRILCFGDSLTEGYSSMGWSMTPYSRWMEEYLHSKLDDEFLIEVVTDGRSGDCVRTGFERRMGRQYPPNTTTPYSWVIFLGGTNDLAYRHSPPEILSPIKSTLSLPLSHGTKALIMTIPEIESRILDAERNELNGLIRGWVGEMENVELLDLWEKMRYHGITKEERRERWDDGLHFTSRGYEMMGRVVGERLVEILRGEEGDGLGH